jgi:hypothetical protein
MTLAVGRGTDNNPNSYTYIKQIFRKLKLASVIPNFNRRFEIYTPSVHEPSNIEGMSAFENGEHATKKARTEDTNQMTQLSLVQHDDLDP